MISALQKQSKVLENSTSKPELMDFYLLTFEITKLGHIREKLNLEAENGIKIDLNESVRWQQQNVNNNKPAVLNSLGAIVNYMLCNEDARMLLALTESPWMPNFKNNIQTEMHTLRKPKLMVHTAMYVLESDVKTPFLLGHGPTNKKAHDHLNYQIVCYLINQLGLSQLKSKMFSGNTNSLTDDEIWTIFRDAYLPGEPLPRVRSVLD